MTKSNFVSFHHPLLMASLNTAAIPESIAIYNVYLLLLLHLGRRLLHQSWQHHIILSKPLATFTIISHNNLKTHECVRVFVLVLFLCEGILLLCHLFEALALKMCWKVLQFRWRLERQVCVCVHMCCVCIRVRVYVCVRVRACTSVHQGDAETPTFKSDFFIYWIIVVVHLPVNMTITLSAITATAQLQKNNHESGTVIIYRMAGSRHYLSVGSQH